MLLSLLVSPNACVPPPCCFLHSPHGKLGTSNTLLFSPRLPRTYAFLLPPELFLSSACVYVRTEAAAADSAASREKRSISPLPQALSSISFPLPPTGGGKSSSSCCCLRPVLLQKLSLPRAPLSLSLSRPPLFSRGLEGFAKRARGGKKQSQCTKHGEVHANK